MTKIGIGFLKQVLSGPVIFIGGAVGRGAACAPPLSPPCLAVRTRAARDKKKVGKRGGRQVLMIQYDMTSNVITGTPRLHKFSEVGRCDLKSEFLEVSEI